MHGRRVTIRQARAGVAVWDHDGPGRIERTRHAVRDRGVLCSLRHIQLGALDAPDPGLSGRDSHCWAAVEAVVASHRHHRRCPGPVLGRERDRLSPDLVCPGHSGGAGRHRGVRHSGAPAGGRSLRRPGAALRDLGRRALGPGRDAERLRHGRLPVVRLARGIQLAGGAHVWGDALSCDDLYRRDTADGPVEGRALTPRDPAALDRDRELGGRAPLRTAGLWARRGGADRAGGRPGPRAPRQLRRLQRAGLISSPTAGKRDLQTSAQH